MTVPFASAEEPASPLPVLVSADASKVGLKLARVAPTDDAAVLAMLRPALARVGVAEHAVRAWAAASAVAPHPLGNVQLGAGFVTLYRHPASFGHVDIDDPAQRAAARLTAATAATRPSDDARRALSILVREEGGVPYTPCEEAQAAFQDAVIWGDDNGACKAAIEALDGGEEGVLARTTCPGECRVAIQSLIEGCDECALEWTTCEETIPDDFTHAHAKYRVTTEVWFHNFTHVSGDHDAASFAEAVELSGCRDAMREEFMELFEPLHEANDYEYDIDGVNNIDFSQGPLGTRVRFQFDADMGAIGATESADEFLAVVRSALAEGYNDEMLLHGVCDDSPRRARARTPTVASTPTPAGARVHAAGLGRRRRRWWCIGWVAVSDPNRRVARRALRRRRHVRRACQRMERPAAGVGARRQEVAATVRRRRPDRARGDVGERGVRVSVLRVLARDAAVPRVQLGRLAD